MKQLKTLYLIRKNWGGHPVFRPLADALNADIFVVDSTRIKTNNHFLNRALQYLFSVYLAFKIPNNYDIILGEAGMSISSLARKLHRLRNSKIVGILSAGSLSYDYIKHNKNLKLSYHFIKDVDVFICPSKYVMKLARKIFPGQKMFVVYGFPNPQLRKYININKLPSLESKNLLLIGSLEQKNRIRLKGVDLLIEAFKLVKEKYPDTELNIAGKFNQELISEWENIPGLHFINAPTDKKLADLINHSSLYVHLGRDDAFPTSVLDAMLGGLPVIVSNETGSIDFMDRLNSNLVSPLNPRIAADKIKWYFELDKKKKMVLSKKAVAIALSFNKEKIIKKFKVDLIHILAENYKK